MKELSIEEKAKRYDEAFEIARKINSGEGVEASPDWTIPEVIFHELRENKDEKIRKGIMSILKHYKESGAHVCPYPFVSIDESITWLEKQSQKDPCEDCKHPMLNCHNFPCSKKQKYQGKSALEAAKEEKVDNANKVEPKFKENDWITNGEDTIQITMVDTKSGHSGYYRCFEGSHGFGWYVIDIESANKNYHLWTIADAKDGDILTFDNNVCTMGTIICKSPTSYDTKSYCRLTDEHFIGEEESGWDSRFLVPATKEQRKLLFSKMKETSYEWDSDTKELKKIETINIPFSAKDSELIEATYFIPEGFHAEIVDNKVIIKKGKQKSSWSEEDKRITSAISQLLKDCESENGWNCVYFNDREVFFVDIEKWLQSLKQRYI